MTDANGPSSGLKPYHLEPGEGAEGFGSDVKASRISTGGAFTLIESRTTGGAPLHVHRREDEYFYVVEGVILVRCGEERFEAGPRSFVFLPRDVPHWWDVGGDGTATLLMMTVPAMLEEFLGEFHAATTPEARAKVAEKYEIEFLPDD
jgi:mannose-6-phosphate isomerase-like protein (cupin superfamily)